MHAYIPHEVEIIQGTKPLGVVGNDGLALGKVYKAAHLPLEAHGVVVYFLKGHHAAHIALAGGVAYYGGAAAQQYYGQMPRTLHMSHGHKGNVMADMQAVCGGIKANIKGDFFLAQQLVQLLGMGTLLKETSFGQHIVYVIHGNLLLFPTIDI